ncbi:MAG: hypothetical protein WCA82_08840 [Jiangellales bacterium]
MTRLLMVFLSVLILTACGNSDEAADDGVLELTFDGAACTYDGPTQVAAGPVELHFVNDSDGPAAVNLLILDEGMTVQDVIDYIGPEPTTRHHPSWTHELGTWRQVASGDTQEWEGELEVGTHVMVCARLQPLGVWFGTGLTVDA